MHTREYATTQPWLQSFQPDYDPDLDTTAELDEDQATYYQSQIGILH